MTSTVSDEDCSLMLLPGFSEVVSPSLTATGPELPSPAFKLSSFEVSFGTIICFHIFRYEAPVSPIPCLIMYDCSAPISSGEHKTSANCWAACRCACVGAAQVQRCLIRLHRLPLCIGQAVSSSNSSNSATLKRQSTYSISLSSSHAWQTTIGRESVVNRSSVSSVTRASLMCGRGGSHHAPKPLTIV